MRHQKKRHKLGRTTSHRKATLAALSSSLIEHKRITTTVPKAKALRTFIEPLITRAKEDTTHNRRQVFRRLQDKGAVTTLFTDVSEQVGDRPGGYTRVVKLGRRAGDGAPLAMIELVDYNDVQPDTGTSGRKRTRRGGGKGRRRSRPKGAESQGRQAAEAKTTPTKQVETGEKGVEDATVEEPIAEEQATPVTERTEAGDVPAEQVEAAEEAVEEQKARKKKAEAEAAAEADTSEAAAETDTTEAPAETDAGAEQAEDSAASSAEEPAAETDAREASSGAETEEDEPDDDSDEKK